MKNALGTEIAIIGMSARLPGAPDVQTYWSNLREGIESIQRFSEEELVAANVPRHIRRDPNFVPAHGAIDHLEGFDAGFFGLSPQDAALMDPQHRVFLQEVWSALEDAGIDPAVRPEAVGVFAGCGMNTYFNENLASNPALLERLGYFHVRHTGNDKDFLATRVSYEYDLTGPSVSVQTACSTSLVAVHQAVQSLLSGECDVAIAGGSTIELRDRWGYLYQEGGVQSPDGHCRAFDANAQGTVFGNGAGVVVLKRYDEAVADGDQVHAVIRGSAINNDGAQKVGYLAPSVDGQAAAAAEALSMSGLDPSSITYIECHGTGTPVGDPIELAALKQVYGAGGGSKRVALGSVKTNIGHLDTAAGVASLIKVVLALKNKQIPPSLNFRTPNPKLEIDSSSFYVNDTLREWTHAGSLRRAAVNSLGVGGTNAHVILEEAIVSSATASPETVHVVPLSAKTPEAVDRAVQNLGQHLERAPETSLADVAYTLQEGRVHFPYRRALVGKTLPDLIEAAKHEESAASSAHIPRDLGFLFPGGGAQYPNMARDVYATEAVFRDVVDQGLAFLKKEEDIDLRPILFPERGQEDDVREELQRPSRALPALLIIEVAMARLWMSWGLEPDGMIGHSAGEYAAACVAEVMTLEQALRLITLRGRLFETLPAGGMLSVPLSETRVRDLLPEPLSIATVNAPDLCVVSGPVGAIARFEEELGAQDVDVRRVPIDVAAHSPMVESILDEFRAFTETLSLRPPVRRFASNLSGTWITDAEATSPDYWVRHIRETVRFADGVRSLFELSNPLFLEVGPGHTLTTFADIHQDRPQDLVVCSTIRHPKEEGPDDTCLYRSVGRAWASGLEIDWSRIRKTSEGRITSLPTYPFARDVHWVEPRASQSGTPDRLVRREAVDDFFSVPRWTPSPLLGSATTRDVTEQTWLVFADDDVGPGLVKRAQTAGIEVIQVTRGRRFREKGPDAYVVRPDTVDDYTRLFEHLGDRANHISRVVHAWNVADSPVATERDVERAGAGWRSLFLLGQALSEAALFHPLELVVLANRLHALPGDGELDPLKATLFGPARVLSREMPTVSSRIVDLELPSRSNREESLDRLWTELIADPDDEVVAYRNGRRFIQDVASVELEDEPSPTLDPDGVYLITGGTGGLALNLVEHLAQEVPATFVLVSRSGLPDRDTWSTRTETHGLSDPIVKKIESVRGIEAHGATVHVEAADVTDARQMKKLVRRIASSIGPIRGVFHAAGVLDDALLPMKTEADVERVLAPKLQGTQVLRDALADQPLDVFVLFSSVSALLGLPGQVDYAAANAYLDAFAHQNTLDGTPTLAINWSAWSEVGLAAQMATGTQDGRAGHEVSHPLLDRWVQTDDGYRFTGSIHSGDWIVDEHRLTNGMPVLPGTGVLELVVAATQVLHPDANVFVRELVFEAPLVVNEEVEVEVALTPSGDNGYGVMISSRVPGGVQMEHARGTVDWVETSEGLLREELDEAFNSSGTTYESHTGFPTNHQHKLVTFGPHWNVLEWMSLDRGTGWARLELDEAYAGEEDTYSLHPALLDIATGFALPLVDDYEERGDVYVPIMYSNASFGGSLPSRVISRIVCENPGADDVITFRVTLWADDGTHVADIEAFTMKRVEPEQVFASAEARGPAAPMDGGATVQRGGAGLLLDPDWSLTPVEGRAVFDRILATDVGPQVFVSTVDVSSLQAHVHDEYSSPDLVAEGSDGAGSSEEGKTTGEGAPRDEIERGVAQIWSSMLGIPAIDIHDDYFALGGHSLIAVRIFAKVKKEMGVDLPLSSLLQAPTIAEYASLIRTEKGLTLDVRGNGEEGEGTTSESSVAPSAVETEFDPLVPIQRASGRRPFFCVHGAGGNVLNFRDLATRLGPDQPFFGLQARGVNGRHRPHRTIQAMASEYLEAVRREQPKGPYVIGGYSGGGVIAYEMAQQLQRDGETVGLLAFIDTYYPHLENGAPTRLADRLRMRWGQLRRERWGAVRRYVADRLVYEQFRLRSFGIWLYETMGWPLPISLREILMVRTFHEAASCYEPSPYSGRIVLFGAEDKGDFTGQVGDDLGWAPMIESGLEVYPISGNHDTLVLEPNITNLAGALRSEIDDACSSSTSVR